MPVIDYEKVAEVIGSFNLPSFDEQTVGKLVSKAEDTWLEDDLKTFDIQAVEREIIVKKNGLVRKGFIDLYGERDRVPCVVDWKIRVGDFSDSWLNRLKENRQGLFYHILLCEDSGDMPYAVQYSFRAISTKDLRTHTTKKTVTGYDLIHEDLDIRRWDSLIKDQLSYGTSSEWADNRS